MAASQDVQAILAALQGTSNGRPRIAVLNNTHHVTNSSATAHSNAA
jgi:hypothetical protein